MAAHASMQKLQELLRKLQTPTKTLSAKVDKGGRCSVLVYVTGSKVFYANYAPRGDECVKIFLLRVCADHKLELGRCVITLNGRPFSMTKDMRIRELPDDTEKGVPWFVIAV